MAHASIYQTRKDVTEEKVAEIYTRTRSTFKVAMELKISTSTAARCVRALGLSLNGRSSGKTKAGKSYSAFAKWLRRNPGAKLPRKPSEIAKLTNCTIDSVKSYLKRRKKAAELMEQALPDLTDVKLVLRTLQGIYVRTRDLRKVRVTCNYATMEYEIQGTDKEGQSHNFRITASTLNRKLKEIGELS